MIIARIASIVRMDELDIEKFLEILAGSPSLREEVGRRTQKKMCRFPVLPFKENQHERMKDNIISPCRPP
jgi:hypothetical protein